MTSKETVKNVENRIHKRFGQEALEELIKYIPREKTINSLYNKEVDELIEIIKEGLKIEESKKQPTFSECIKEWESRGFTVVSQEKGYVINGFLAGLKDKYISIRLQGKQYVWLSDETFLSYEEVHLISKTLKALEVKYDNN